jgi:hypothetical protein
MIEIGDCVEDVNAAIAEEETKLQVILDQSEHKLLGSPTSAISTNSHEWGYFYYKLQGSIKTQVSLIKDSVAECYNDDNDSTVHKIDLHSAKDEFKKSLSTQLAKAKVQVFESSKVSVPKMEVGQVTGGSEIVYEVTKPRVEICYGEVVYQSVDQAQKETEKALSYAVIETQNKLSSWYNVFFGRIKAIKFSPSDNGAQYKKEVENVISSSLEEAALIIKEAKSSFEFKYTVSANCPSEVDFTVKNSQKQALESLDSIYTIVTEQTSVIQEVVSTTDFPLIQEKISIIEEQSRRKTQAALEATPQTAISAGFEGKTVTWVETASVPSSFKDVKVFAFDLVDTVVNYRASISKAWYKIVKQKKNACTLSSINVEGLIVRWYYLYLEYRMKAKHTEMDISILLTTLKLVLIEYSISNSFEDSELKTLCSAWLSLELFDDASASIRKIKQLDGVYAVAISHAFTIRTMMDLARSGCLCWHAQFTADMFAACTINNGTSPDVTVVSNTAMLLGLNKASELAVVSSNPMILEAAKSYGSKTVSLNRFSSAHETKHSFDIEFDGLDIFAESFQTFFETKVITTKVEVPVSRSWFQRVISTVTETAETVSHAIVG